VPSSYFESDPNLMNPKRLRPSAYLWARCEGWAKIGVCRSERKIGDWRGMALEKRRHRLCRDIAGFGFDGGEDAVAFAAGGFEVGGF